MTVNCKDGRFELNFAAVEADASKAIASLHAGFAQLGLPEHKSSDIKIAVTEAINNVVEHAYIGLSPGVVIVKGRVFPEHLDVQIWDSGNPLPGLCIPDGVPASVETSLQNLPEGGFGWFMIRNLTDSVRYDRRLGLNRLYLRFDFDKNIKRPQ